MTEPTNTTPSVLRWVDDVPAPIQFPHRRENPFTLLFETLRANPGHWALVGDGRTGVTAGSVGFLRSEGFLVRTRTDHESPERDAKGRKPVRVYAQFPKAEEEPSAI